MKHRKINEIHRTVIQILVCVIIIVFKMVILLVENGDSSTVVVIIVIGVFFDSSILPVNILFPILTPD